MARLRERLEAEHGWNDDDAQEDVMLRRRIQAVRRLISLNADRPPDARTLSRMLDEAHKPCDIH